MLHTTGGAGHTHPQPHLRGRRGNHTSLDAHHLPPPSMPPQPPRSGSRPIRASLLTRLSCVSGDHPPYPCALADGLAALIALIAEDVLSAMRWGGQGAGSKVCCGTCSYDVPCFCRLVGQWAGGREVER